MTPERRLLLVGNDPKAHLITPHSALAQLNERSREIFRQIVESYLATGEPVGSRNISRLITVPLSPASVRNVMSDLEQLGLIYAPHTSAGRLPTELGLRFFVDAMVRNKTYCGITRDRILILREGSRAELRSLNLRTLSDISITSAADGSGNISFGPSHPAASVMGKGAWPGASRYQAPSFELAENVQQVYSIVHDAQKRA